MERPWHAWYRKFAPVASEVETLQLLEPLELPEWAVKLRLEFPTLPPEGVEMCHARWLETLDRLVEDIGDGAYRRRAHSCGDLPLETVAGLGLRRRILKAWLTGTTREKLMEELAVGLGHPPDTADLLFDVLGDHKKSPQDVRQDIETLCDLFSGPYEAGNAPIQAKWRVRVGELEGRRSILAALKDQFYPVLTNLCNYRTLSDVDRIIGMVARQKLDLSMLGPCNMSLKFLLQDQPERISASIAVVWTLHRYAADEFQGEVTATPLGVRDQCNALLKRLGHSDPLKGWLATTLGFMVKKWVRRAWHIMEANIPESALPDFSFLNSPLRKAALSRRNKEGGATAMFASAQPSSGSVDPGSVMSRKGGAGRAPALGGGAPKAPSLAPALPHPAEGAAAPAPAAPKFGVPPPPAPAVAAPAAVAPPAPAAVAVAAPPAAANNNEVKSNRQSQGLSLAEIRAAAAAVTGMPAKPGDAPPNLAPGSSGDDWDAPITIGGNTRILTPPQPNDGKPAN